MMVSSVSSAQPLLYPYSAILWIIQHAPPNQFLGNPVRHFQHLASRMNLLYILEIFNKYAGRNSLSQPLNKYSIT